MIKKTLTFLLVNSYSKSSTLVLKTINLQNSSIVLLLMSHKHRAQPYKQINKQEQLRTIHKTKRSLKRAYKRIGLVATVTRAQETRKKELRLKRNNYLEDLCYKRNKRTIGFYLF
jgi:hypothetical protein